MTSVLVSWWLWVQFPYWPEFFSGLVLTIGLVVFIPVKIASVFISLSAVHM